MEIGGISLALAFAAGLLSCVSPCVLPVAAPYLGTLLGASGAGVATRRSVLLNGACFLFGFLLLFVLLGLAAGAVGFSLRENLPLLRKVGGGLMVVFGLATIGIIRLPFGHVVASDPAARLPLGYTRSFVSGASVSAAWIPCIGPTLGAILTLAVNAGVTTGGVILMLAYALGLAIPFFLVGAVFVRAPSLFVFASRHHRPISIVSGIIIIAVGLMVFTNAFAGLNRYFNWSGSGPGAGI